MEITLARGEFNVKASITDIDWLNRFQKALQQGKRIPGTAHPLEIFYTIHLIFSDDEDVFIQASRDLSLYHTKEQAWLESDILPSLLRPAMLQFEASIFGKPLPWQQVCALFPKKTKATIQDLDTGISFMVHRYGGVQHADLEPVTLQDTAKLKAIFDGEWSWKRRGVILKVGDQRIAASIHGMPHAGSDLRDNAFPGHFCLHVQDSKTHTTNRIDAGHEQMIQKASGQLWDTIQESQPQEIIEIALLALGNKDTVTLVWIFGNGEQEEHPLWTELLKSIRFLQIHTLTTRTKTDTKAHVQAQITVSFFYPHGDSPHVLDFVLTRDHAEHPWTVNPEDLAPLMEEIE